MMPSPIFALLALGRRAGGGVLLMVLAVIALVWLIGLAWARSNKAGE
jgi:hypothetical protein